MRKLAITGLTGITAIPIGLALMPIGCSELPPAVVSIRPIYAWEDGCTQVKVSGNSFGDDVEVTVGGEPLSNLTQPDPEESPLDVGFVLYGTVPPGAPGNATVEMSSGDVTDDIPDGFNYIACPSAAYVEVMDPATGIGNGSTVNLVGCGLDTAEVSVRVGPNPTDVPITSNCGSADVSFSAPDNTDGTWIVAFYDAQGSRISPSDECDITQPVEVSDDTGSYTDYVYDVYYPDSGGEDDPCSGALILTYGGAR